jgi:hypothetical protein
MTREQKNEKEARAEFEFWATEGTKPYLYVLGQCANGEYISHHTEFAWKAFFAGWNKNR